MEHVTFETLNDLVDDRLDGASATKVREHLASCEECLSEHDRLLNLLAATSTATRSIDPDDGVWLEIKKSIDQRKEVALPIQGRAPESRHSAPAHGRSWNRPWMLAAAAVVLMALSSGITAIVLRTSSSSGEPVADASYGAPAISTVLQASFGAAEAEYDRTIRELKVAVDAQRSSLTPETIRTVDHSLAIVDSAIAEARAALAADPNNRTLVDLLASSYQRKLDLLRRTSELSSKI